MHSNRVQNYLIISTCKTNRTENNTAIICVFHLRFCFQIQFRLGSAQQITQSLSTSRGISGLLLPVLCCSVLCSTLFDSINNYSEYLFWVSGILCLHKILPKLTSLRFILANYSVIRITYCLQECQFIIDILYYIEI